MPQNLHSSGDDGCILHTGISHSCSWACMDLSLLSSPSLSSYSTRQKSWIFQKELNGGFTKHLHMLEVTDFWKQPNTFHNTGHKTVHFFHLCSEIRTKLSQPPLSKDWMFPYIVHNSPDIFPMSFFPYTDSTTSSAPWTWLVCLFTVSLM